MEKQLQILVSETDVKVIVSIEAHNADFFGGEGSTGYSQVTHTFDYKNKNAQLIKKYIDKVIDESATSLNVNKEDIHVISAEEYENTSEDEYFSFNKE